MPSKQEVVEFEVPKTGLHFDTDTRNFTLVAASQVVAVEQADAGCGSVLVFSGGHKLEVLDRPDTASMMLWGAATRGGGGGDGDA